MQINSVQMIKKISKPDSDDEMIEHFDRLAATNIKRTTNISGIDCDLGLDYDWSICDYDVSC